MVTMPTIGSTVHTPLALSWAIKHSLISYVSAMSDGTVEASGGALRDDNGFVFPSDPHPGETATAVALRFSGTVTCSGHEGLLRVIIADPWLEPGTSSDATWLLTIADPYSPGARLTFATINHISSAGVAKGCLLTADGADLFFSGPYTEGTELEPPTVLYHA